MTKGTAICQGADQTEAFRRQRLAQLNPGIDRTELERRYGTVLDSKEIAAVYEVIGFMAPLVVVRRKAGGNIGSMEFQHAPRLYFNWQEDRDDEQR